MMKRMCIKPWRWASILPDGRVMPCCEFNDKLSWGNLQTASFDEIYNGEEAKKTRKSFLQNKFPAACKSCESKELLGIPSLRQQGESYPDDSLFQSTYSDIHEITHLEIKMSNLCNLRCRICGPLLSTAWYQEGNEFYKDNFNQINQVLSYEKFRSFLEMDLPAITAINFSGGEPLINPGHAVVLSQIIKNNHENISITYNTNLENLDQVSPEIISHWRGVKAIEFRISIDGGRRIHEFTRKGSSWDRLISNIDKIEHLVPKAKIVIATTVSALNVFSLVNFIDEVKTTPIKKHILNLNFNLLERPDHYNVSVLNESEKDIIRNDMLLRLNDVIADYGDNEKRHIIEEFEKIKNSLNITYTPSHRRTLRYLSIALDKSRAERLVSFVPELFNLIYVDI